MTVQDELVQRFNESQTKLQQVVQGLDEQRATTVWYGHWGVREILAHIAGWEAAMGEALENVARGARPTADGITVSDVEGTNDQFAAAAAGKSFQQVLGELASAGERFTAAVRALPDDRVAEGKTGRRIAETIIGHPVEHIEPILQWRQGSSA